MIGEFEPGPNRATLGFKEAVLSAFYFLTTEYGFRCVKTEVTFVRYESSSAFINIYHGRGSFELGFEIGPLAESPELEEHFSLGDVVDVMDARKETGYNFFQVSDREGVQKFVPRLAELVRKYADLALRGNQEFFRRLREMQTQKSDLFLKEMRLEQIRPKVEIAWREKNYRKAVELYESVHNDLSSLELQKLDYARKKLKERR